MDDSQIVALFWQHNEDAIAEAQKEYGRYCFSIANQILRNEADAEEIVNDAMAGAWNAIPPHRPAVLSTFLGKITRRLSLKRLRERTAEKRQGDEVSLSLEELGECIPASSGVEEAVELKELAASISAFLDTLSAEERRVFIRRYWFFDPVQAICSRFGYSESKTKMMLKRTRDRLALWLKKEGMIP